METSRPPGGERRQMDPTELIYCSDHVPLVWLPKIFLQEFVSRRDQETHFESELFGQRWQRLHEEAEPRAAAADRRLKWDECRFKSRKKEKRSDSTRL